MLIMRLASGHDMLDSLRLIMAFAHPYVFHGPQETCPGFSHMKLHCLCALQSGVFMGVSLDRLWEGSCTWRARI